MIIESILIRLRLIILRRNIFRSVFTESVSTNEKITCNLKSEMCVGLQLLQGRNRNGFIFEILLLKKNIYILLTLYTYNF